MPGFYATQIPGLRAPTGIDFSPLTAGFDDLAKTLERNRLLSESRAIGSALNSQPPMVSSQPPQIEPNRLLSFTQPPSAQGAPVMSPAQASAAAAGRDYSPTPAGAMNPVNVVRGFEGFSPNAYGDYKQTSIGYGTKALPGETTISRPAAEGRLNDEVQKVADFVDRELPGLDPEKRSALVSFGYNLGTGQGGLSDLLPAARAGRWSEVSAAMQAYRNAGGEPNSGLIKRRAAEGSLVQGRGAPVAAPRSAAPASAPQSSGINYTAGIRTALAQGNIPLASQLIQQQRAEEAAGRQDQLFPYQLEAAQSGATKDRAELENLATLQMGKVANAIQNAPEASRGAMWQRVIQSHPEMARALQENGVDPSDANAGASFFVNMAKGITPPQLTEVSPGATLVDKSNPTKGIFTAPRPAQNLSVAERKEVFDSDAAAQAGEGAIMTLRKALDLNSKAYSGPLAQTRGYATSLFGVEGGQATEDLNNLITAQALDQLKATFGAAPTEGERKILLDIQGSTNQAPEVRKTIWERAIQMAERRVQFNKNQSEAIRSGEYFKSGYSPVTSQQQAQPSPQGSTPAAPVASAPKPQGVSDQQIIAEAQKAIEAGKDPAAVREQLKAWGIQIQ